MNVLAASFWGSNIGLGVVLAAVFAAVWLLVVMFAGVRARRRREMGLAKRLGRRGAPVGEQALSEDEGSTTQWVPEALATAGERFAEATGFSEKLDMRLERAGVPILAGEFVALTAVSAVLGALFAALLLQNLLFILLIGGVIALVPWLWMMRAESKRQRALNDQLADTLSILASSLRAGYSFLQALDTVSKEIGEPSAEEFQRAVAEIRLGRPVEDALLAMADRVGSEDLLWAVLAMNVQRQVGGNLAEVLDIVAETVRERSYLRRQVGVLTAEGRISAAILTALPFLVLIYIAIVQSDYIEPLFTTTRGLVLLLGGGLWMAIGIFIMFRMVKIDV